MAVSLSPLPPTTAHRAEPQTATPAAPAQLIDLKEVCRRTGLGRSTIQNLIHAGKFPQKLKDPDVRATRWDAAAVEAWILDRIAAGSRR